ncbi:MAG: ACT domain-containing protein [Phoenicibacter congonensis]|uniref:UPF0237 protein Q3982_02455 n=1 Tax=Phoenicibacter congonensis TaxID=1944646 RepID=A0AA43RGP7_9ACTN|nr:ACT domain-containing protein [Phoenicibacter congonensis]
MKCVVSVLGADRIGIVADVTTALASFGANIDDISQTVVGGIFSMTLIATLTDESVVFDDVNEKLKEVGKKLGVEIYMQREDVYRAMYEI